MPRSMMLPRCCSAACRAALHGSLAAQHRTFPARCNTSQLFATCCPSSIVLQHCSPSANTVATPQNHQRCVRRVAFFQIVVNVCIANLAGQVFDKLAQAPAAMRALMADRDARRRLQAAAVTTDDT